MATTKTSQDRFIGIAIEDFFAETDAQTKAGRYTDGTEMKPIVRDALQTFTKSLRGQQLRISSYVFAFSRHVVIFIDF